MIACVNHEVYINRHVSTIRRALIQVMFDPTLERLKIGICLIAYDTVFQHKLISFTANFAWRPVLLSLLAGTCGPRTPG